METRLLGRTGHQSSVITFGAIMVGKKHITQKIADQLIELALSQGVNHIDVAPTYGEAMERLAPWMPQIRSRIFLGTKTGVRTRAGARESIHNCLTRLGVKDVDLFQLHGISSMESLDEVTRVGGALEALIEAKNQGLTKWIGITGHGPESPNIQLEALKRFDFDTIMFPINAAIWPNKQYRIATNKLIETAEARNVGIQAIKMLARGGWGNNNPDCSTWYDPHRDQINIDNCIWWLLSHPVHTAPSTGEHTLFGKILDAAKRFQPLTKQDQMQIVRSQNIHIPEPKLGILGNN